MVLEQLLEINHVQVDGSKQGKTLRNGRCVWPSQTARDTYEEGMPDEPSVTG